MAREWESREQLEAAVVGYQLNWWRTDAGVLALVRDPRSHPRLRGAVVSGAAVDQIVTTAEIYKVAHSGGPHAGAGSYLPEREDLHDRIVGVCVPSSPGDTSVARSAYFTIGCPGAGKTSVLRGIVDLHRGSPIADPSIHPYSIVDADRVRQLLPEYADGLGSLVVQQECFDITYGKVFDAAVDRRADIVYDTIGLLPSIRDNLDLLHSRGYQIHLLLAQADEVLCRERTDRRALRVDGRLVDPDRLRAWTVGAEETARALLAEGYPLASWARIDTCDMDNPMLIEGTSPWQELLRSQT